MESAADIVVVLVLAAVGSFAGGILFGLWLMRKIQPEKPHVRVKPLRLDRDHRDAMPTDWKLGGPFEGQRVPLSGKFQPTAPNRIGLSNLIRDLESDDPEAKRHEQIMKANGGD